MKRLSVNAVGLAASETASLGAFLDLVALDDGHVFVLDKSATAPILFVNPASSEGAQELATPSSSICVVGFGAKLNNFPGLSWMLAMPLRLPQLREILVSIVEKRRDAARLQQSLSEATRESVKNPWHESTSAHCTAAQGKLQHMLRVMSRITKGRVVHEICGIPGVEITIFPDLAKVSVRSNTGVWTSALLAGTRNLHK